MPESLTGGSTESAASSSSATSTSDIAASVISDMEAGNATDDSAAPAATSDSTPAKPAAATATEVDPDDFDAVPAEITDSLNRKRPNAIPHPRVKQMIEKREKKLIAAVAKELGITKAEAELKLEDVIGEVQGRGTKLTKYETQLKNVTAAERLMVNDPDRFMEMLVKVNPKYGEFKRQQQQVAAAAEAQAAGQGQDDPEPQPDYDLGNGLMTYSVQGLRKLREWERRQAVKEITGTLDQRIKPIEEQRRQEEQRAAAQREAAERQAQLQKRVERARQWPQFKEHEKDILAHMDGEKAKGRFISFEDAYMQVVVPKLAGDRTKMRQELLDEINGQPKSTSVSTTTAPKHDERPKTTADIAREVMASFK